MFARKLESCNQKLLYHSLKIGKLCDILKICEKELNEIKREFRKDQIEGSLMVGALALANLPTKLANQINVEFPEHQAHLKIIEMVSWVFAITVGLHYSYRVYTAPTTKLADLFEKYQWNSALDNSDRSDLEIRLLSEVKSLVEKIHSDQTNHRIYLKQDYEELTTKVEQLKKVHFGILQLMDAFVTMDKVNEIIQSNQSSSFLSNRTVGNVANAMKNLEKRLPGKEFSISNK